MNEKLLEYSEFFNSTLFLQVFKEGVLESINNIQLSYVYNKIYAYSVSFDAGNGSLELYFSAENINHLNCKKYLEVYKTITCAEQYVDFLNEYGWEKGLDYAPIFYEKFYNGLKLNEQLISAGINIIENRASEDLDVFVKSLADAITKTLVELFNTGEFNSLPLAGKFGVILFRFGCDRNENLGQIRKYGHNFGFSLTTSDFIRTLYNSHK